MNIKNVYQLPANEKENILNGDIKPSFSRFPNIPLFKYGFHYYIHQTKDKMATFEQPEFKNKDIHKITNPFEDTIPQDDFIKQFKSDKIKSTDDMNTFSIKYFQTDKIISRAFYKLWELLIMFPLVKNQSNFTSIHIAEAPGSFVQSVIYYRQKMLSDSVISKDKYIATSIASEKIAGKYVPSFSSNLRNIKQLNIWTYKNSDLTKLDIIDKFVSDNEKNKGDLITADGGFNWKDENYQEQEAYILLLAEIYCALNVQKIGGCFVIKFFETFTELTIKMFEILKRVYNYVYITKPLLSRPTNSEKYIVCVDFIGIEAKYLNKIYKVIKESNERQNDYITDIFPNYVIPTKLDMIIKLSSTQLSNEQHKLINEMVTYVNDGNYFGDAYRKYLMLRKEANDFWISTFYPLTQKDISSIKKLVKTLVEQSIENVNKKINELENDLQFSIL